MWFFVKFPWILANWSFNVFLANWCQTACLPDHCRIKLFSKELCRVNFTDLSKIFSCKDDRTKPYSSLATSLPFLSLIEITQNWAWNLTRCQNSLSSSRLPVSSVGLCNGEWISSLFFANLHFFAHLQSTFFFVLHLLDTLNLQSGWVSVLIRLQPYFKIMKSIS